MKKITAWILLVAMLLSMFAGCKQVESDPTDGTTVAPTEGTEPLADPDGLAAALEYLKTIYKNDGGLAPKDFTRIGTVPVGATKYEVVWTTDVGEDVVKIVVGDNGMVTIDVNEEVSEDTPFVLTATITDAAGNSVSHSWNYTIPAAMDMGEVIMAAYALAPGESLPYEATLVGKIISIDTLWSADYQNITVTIVVEGYEDYPIQCYRLAGDGAEMLAVGDTITVTGTLSNYNGTIEFAQGCTLDNVVSGGGTPPTPVEYSYTTPLEDGQKVVIYATSYNRALSEEKVSSFYNKGVKVSKSGGKLTGYTATEVWTVIKNSNGTYSFANADGEKLGMIDDYSNVDLGGKYNKWGIIKLGSNKYLLENTGRKGFFLEWYEKYGNFSTYDSYTPDKDKQFYMSFYILGEDDIPAEKEDYSDTYVSEFVTEPADNTAYKLGLKQESVKGKPIVYFNGEISNSYYLATTENPEEAVDVYKVPTTGGFYLKFVVDGKTQYINITQNEYKGELKSNMAISDTPTSVFTYDADQKAIKTLGETDGEEYYIGTYSTYTTLSASNISHLTDDDSITAQFITVKKAEGPATLEDAVTYLTDNYLDNQETGATYTMPGIITIRNTDFTVAWTVNDNGAGAVSAAKGSDGNYTITVTRKDADTPYTLTATVTDSEGNSEALTWSYTVPQKAASVEVVTAPVAGKAYKLGLTQANLNKVLFLNGELDGTFFATSARTYEAVDVFVEEVSGGIRIYFMDGTTKTYVDMYEYEAGKVGIGFNTTPTAVYTIDTERQALVTEVLGDKYYLGTYGTYATISKSNYSYIEDVSVVGVSQFPAILMVVNEETPVTLDAAVEDLQSSLPADNSTTANDITAPGKITLNGQNFTVTYTIDPANSGAVALTGPDASGNYTVDVTRLTSGDVAYKLIATVANTKGETKTLTLNYTVPETAPYEVVTAPVAGETYKLAVEQNSLGKTLYFDGGRTSDNKYLSTSDKTYDAVDVTIETSGSGFVIRFGSSYLKVTTAQIEVVAESDQASVFTFNTTYNTPFTTVEGTEYYIGCYNDFNTISRSKTSYMTEANVDVSQFPARLVKVLAETPVTLEAALAEAETYMPTGATTNEDYTLPGTVTLNNIDFAVEWSIEPANSEAVAITKGADGNYTVDVTRLSSGDATYTLKVVVKNADAETSNPATKEYTVSKLAQSSGDTGYTLVTSAADFTSGKYVMVVDSGYSPTYLDGTWVLCEEAVVSDNTATASDNNVWTITVNGNSVKLTDKNGVSIAPKGGNSNGISSGDYDWEWTFADGKFTFKGTGSDTVTFASNSTTDPTYGGLNRFRGYKNTTAAGSDYYTEFSLYKLSDSSGEGGSGGEGGDEGEGTEPTVVTIATALAGTTGTSYTVKGVVTFIDGKNVYLQDSTGGICAYMSTAPASSDLALGDTITATGAFKVYNELPELDAASFEKSSGLTLSAKTTTIAALTEADICTYIEISGLTVTAISGSNYTLTDSNDKTIVLYKPVTSAALEVGNVINFKGALGIFNNLQLRNTLASEITVTSTGSGDEGDEGGEGDEPTVVTIAEALAGTTGTSYTVKGVVTFIDGKNVYLQDSTGGICAYMSTAPASSDLALGDTITATGAFKVYNGLPELDAATFEKSSGLTLSAKTTTIDALKDEDICTYIEISGLTVTAISGSNYTLTDSNDKTIVLYKPVTSAALDVGNVINFKGVLGIYNNLQLRNTLASEITVTSTGSGDEGGEPDPDIPSVTSATISFADKEANRTAYSDTQQVWAQNGITVTNDKASSTTKIGDYENPVRFYASSNITIAFAGMTRIEVTCSSSSYATALKNSVGDAATASGSVVTIVLPEAADSFVIEKLTAQVRVSSITVYTG